MVVVHWYFAVVGLHLIVKQITIVMCYATQCILAINAATKAFVYVALM